MIIISTDKKSYYLGEDVIITIRNNHPPEDENILWLLNVFGITQSDKIQINAGEEFTKTIPSHNFNTGNYLIQVSHSDFTCRDTPYGIDCSGRTDDHPNHTVETDFIYGLEDIIILDDSEFANEITFSLDNISYNAGDEIIFSGTTPREYIWNSFNIRSTDPKGFSTTFSQATVDENGVFTGNIISKDFTINGEYTIELLGTFLDEDLVTSFQYFDPEIVDIDYINFINDNVIDNQQRLDEHDITLDIQNTTMQEYDTMLYSQQEDISIIQDEQTDQRSFIDMILSFLGLSDTLDAPIIISVIADDPDNLDDIYSVDDTITILFDSDTNQPGGTGTQQKLAVDNIFTFSEELGQGHNGEWVTPDTFVITITGINGAGPPVFGITTVTPTGSTLILPADDNADNFSTVTSPVLIGDFGEILSLKAEIKCGSGTYLDSGECIIIDDTSQCGAGTELINGYCKLIAPSK